MQSQQDVLQRSLDRERRARKEAELLLEEKSRELYFVNQELATTAAALREEAKKSSTVLQNAAEGIITFGQSGLIESANPAANRIFASSANELIGTNIRQLVGQDELPGFTTNLFWTCRPLERRSCVGRRTDGTTFEMELSGSRVELDNRLLFTWMVHDATRRRELERQLAFAQKMESVGQLAAGIAHEINTPMQFVTDNLTFLASAFRQLETLLQHCEEWMATDGGKRAAELRRIVQEQNDAVTKTEIRTEIPLAIEQASIGTARVTEIVAAMKEFSHPGTRDKSYIDLNKAIQGTITISRHEWKYVAEIATEFDQTLPKVACFPAELNQALINLIVNAAHAIGDAQPKSALGKITITTSHDRRDAIIRVSDTGMGIPENIRSRIFEPFFTTKAIGKGTGQGLSIVYSVVVEKHGGTLEVTSEVGVGTTFEVRLPLNSPERSVRKDT